MKFKAIALLIATLSSFFLMGTSNADVDFDLDDGVLVIETDERDDIVVPLVEDDELVVYVFQFDAEDMDLDQLKQLVSANSFCGGSLYVNELKMLSDRWRIRDEDLEDVERIIIYTHEGNDYVRASQMEIPVTVFAGPDDDYVNGSRVSSQLYGESGDDELRFDSYFNYSRNIVSGGSGNDSMYGGSGPDVMWGGTGDDEMEGRNGADDMFGGSGNDIMDGGFGDDYMLGQFGMDEMWDPGGGAYMEGGYDGEVDFMGGHSVEVVGFYYRYLDPRRPNKNLIRKLEVEDYNVYGNSVIKGVIK